MLNHFPSIQQSGQQVGKLAGTQLQIKKRSFFFKLKYRGLIMENFRFIFSSLESV